MWIGNQSLIEEIKIGKSPSAPGNYELGRYLAFSRLASFSPLMGFPQVLVSLMVGSIFTERRTYLRFSQTQHVSW